MNVTYEYYKDSFGGSLIPENRWISLELKMSARLNQYTFDRMKEDNWPEQAKTALCEMCDCAYRYDRRDGKTSENNDGYSVSYDMNKTLNVDYEFDLYMNDAVQKKLATITDDELLGSDAQVTVVVVDLFDEKTGESTTCTARKRDWSVIPDTEGDGTDALIYKGSLKAAGEIIKGTATTTDIWQTCTFTAE